MNLKLKILLVSSEASPYAKVGGLGEAVTSLAIALKRLGQDVRILIPYYGALKQFKDQFQKHPAPLGVPLGGKEYWTGVYVGQIPNSEIPIYCIDYEIAFAREGIYGSRTVPFFPDNPFRFALLSRAAFQLCRLLDWIPEIIHTHDWPTSLALVYLKAFEYSGYFQKTRGILTLHNVGYQGIVPKEELENIGLDMEQYYRYELEYYDQINLLKGGILQADYLTAVSPTYAQEILTPQFGSGLEGCIARRKDKLVGILNGIDYDEWNPEKDPYLPYPFSASDLSAKKQVKRFLQDQVGLPQDPSIPIIGMVGRMVDQKGFGLLLAPKAGNLFTLCRDLPVQVIILGTGDPTFEEELARMAWKLPNLKVILQFNTPLSHLIEGGSDFFLMPSLYEPCGLNQMYSLRYGAVPIVTQRGGLVDTVEPYSSLENCGTGFFIPQPDTDSIFQTVKQAVEVYQSKPEVIEKMRRKGMAKRFTWEEAAKKYLQVFEQALSQPNKS
ncbi:MAG: glycogen synthase [Spirochaetales bacterium]